MPRYTLDMLTRSEVAEKLGRSVSTVRRLEGSKLHPKISARGTRLFDPHEVDALAREVEETGRVLESSDRRVPQDDRPSWDDYDDLQAELESARAENRRLAFQVEEAREGSRQGEDALAELRGTVQTWAGEMDHACASLLQAEDDEEQELSLEYEYTCNGVLQEQEAGTKSHDLLLRLEARKRRLG